MHIETQVWLNTFAAAVKQSAGFAEIRTRSPNLQTPRTDASGSQRKEKQGGRMLMRIFQGKRNKKCARGN